MKRHYLAAVCAVGAALLLRYLLNPVLGQQGPYIVLTLPIAAVAVYGGFGPALLATVLGTVAGIFFFVNRGSGLHDLLEIENLVRTGLFFGFGLALSLIGRQMQTSRKALAENMRQLKASNKAKDSAMAILGHEIRNPLSAIHSAQTVLERAPGDAQRVSWASDVIKRQVAQMTRMADDLLDLAGLMNGQVTAAAPVDLRGVLEQALEQSTPLFKKKIHLLDIQIGDRPAVVSGDAQRLVQVFANLLTNAAKYTDPGGKVVVRLALPHADVLHDAFTAVVSIQDNGVGLPAGSSADLFEPFVQAPGAASNAEGGLGLGLAIVRKIVHAHGGEVAAVSEGPGHGSCFTVTLPLAKSSG